ncbi:hypothetical protein COCCADRAFT_107841 [Bipolaris zeicola 26-R-13]|uniref:Uncharacterized protein n=1 Tax=Cochliobolus carbonum (strain 26-R-13) TaxID=930089 RepID=W6YCQ5_COCC2|nr:uncharacterized protein COCCADRAFT_107841 [Bipolaris zeicola 26-R-13]EUC28951.1 hypothetical protein COCCADRAFT_107841 [Bipolaris zeicola 26-R-13]
MDEAETRSDVLSRCKREETGTQACGDTTRVWTWWLGEGGREWSGGLAVASEGRGVATEKEQENRAELGRSGLGRTG